MTIASTINYLDLFSGIGGFRRGLELAGFNFGKEYHSEVDKYAEEIMLLNPAAQIAALGKLEAKMPYHAALVAKRVEEKLMLQEMMVPEEPPEETAATPAKPKPKPKTQTSKPANTKPDGTKDEGAKKKAGHPKAGPG